MKKIILTIILTFAFAGNSYTQWTRVESLNTTYVKDIIYVNGVFIVCALGSGVHISTDEGLTWQQKNTGLTTNESKTAYDIDHINGKLYLASVDGVFASTNLGDNWQIKSNGITIGPGAIKIFAYSVFENNGRMFTGVHNGLYYSTNSGDSWQLTNVSGSHTNVVSFINFNGSLFAGRDSGNPPPAYSSSDNGLVWEPLNIWNNFPVSAFCFYSEQDTLFAGGLGMYVSTNNGQNWTERSNGLALDPYVSSIAKSGNTMIASLKFGGSGMYKTTDNGFNWVSIEDNLPFLTEISKILIHNNFLYITTSTGIWKRPLEDILTGSTSFSEKLPVKYKLNQNFPNPFNPNTKVSYELSVDADVNITVFDVSGKEIIKLVDGFHSAGNYSVDLNADELAGGIYFYKMVTFTDEGEFSQVRKMIFLK